VGKNSLPGMVSHFDGAFSVVIRLNQDQVAGEFKFSRLLTDSTLLHPRLLAILLTGTGMVGHCYDEINP
jgi:hypothetical protein